MVYGAFAALAQKDFKRLVAYSSVSHMGYVVLGLGVWSISTDNFYMSDYWKMGMNGAMFQMIAHGLSSAGMFFLVGVVYDRVHHRDLDRFGGLFAKMPVYSGLAMGIFFAALGLPGLCGFIGEVLVVLSVWNYSTALAVVAASVVILTAGYILWTIQRVYLGPEYKGPHGEALTRMTWREIFIATPLLAFAIVLGVYPQALFNYMDHKRQQGRDGPGRLDRDGQDTENPGDRFRNGPCSESGNPAAVSFQQLVDNLINDTLGSGVCSGSLWAFRPELAVCATVVLLLLLRMVAPRFRSGPFYVTAIGLLAALYFLVSSGLPGQATPIFTGMLVFDSFSVYMRGLVLLFGILFVSFTETSGIPDRSDATEFYVLALGAMLGMCLMVSASHMMTVFLGIEMASVPSYALAGILRHRRTSSEAALKFAVFGAGTAGVMLYGISLLVGALGSAHIPTMAVRLAEMMPGMPCAALGADRVMILVLGGLMLMVGVAFKLSAVPFHFWAPDVFEGATAEVAAFLSVASKAAALGLLVRLGLGFGTISPTTVVLPPAPPEVAAIADTAASDDADTASDAAPAGPVAGVVPMSRTAMVAALAPVRTYIVGLIGLLAAVTCTFGNLAAYGQTNIKRLLAYSTIAHAGYMMMPVAAAVALAGSSKADAGDAVAALAFYAAVYLFMNLGAFAVAAFLRNAIGSEEIDSYAGLVGRSPGLTVCMGLLLFSLVGMPPLAGFMAKFTLFAAVYDANLLGLLAIGVLNTVLSLFYYLRVIRVMAMSAPAEGQPVAEIGLLSVPGMYCLIITLPIVVLGVWWNGLFWLAKAASAQLL